MGAASRTHSQIPFPARNVDNPSQRDLEVGEENFYDESYRVCDRSNNNGYHRLLIAGIKQSPAASGQDD
jgi:hypothetical protein